ncbi:MAG: c-type cytochrome [Pedosphaera sp.]|nr:c-type cytochrome [Pedosphaera sp.]
MAMNRFAISACGFAVVALAFSTRAAEPAKQALPGKVHAASDEGERAIKSFKVADGLKVEVWAAEPLLANPVAFTIDERGRIFVAETFRLHKGITDIRGHMNWLDEELASQSAGDLARLYKKYNVDGLNDYSERIRLIEDRDGDGKADHATVYAEGFNQSLAGLGAGLLARRGQVWFTCIPDLWLLQDTKGTGVADTRKSLAQGFGVRVGFLGHDLHGLRMGPDGRIYFSIGDRGASVVTSDGRKLHLPETGAIYRCEPDGAGLEVFHYGLRNPQELAFDEFGNLFTGDNNSDGGDPARWVYAVEGGDSGWRIGWQFIEKAPWTQRRGPWLEERMCFPDGFAPHRIPPVANIANGPSGLTYYPGVGLPEKYNGNFLLCDFRGSASQSGVLTVSLKQKGAGFEVAKLDKLIWNVLVTDVEAGYDGAIYISDWVEGWGMPGKGRIYRLSDPTQRTNARVLETGKLFSTGFDKKQNAELAELLAHPDPRVRMEAQFQLVEHQAGGLLLDVARRSTNQLARLHAVWGIGQMGRKSSGALNVLLPLLKDGDVEVRAQVAKTLGENVLEKAVGALITSLKDESPRVRAFAAITLGKWGRKEHTGAALQMLRENNDADPIVRHAGVMALVGSKEIAVLANSAKDPSPAVRLGALLALRRLQRPEVAAFLSDTEATIVTEAARAISDETMTEAMPKLAALGGRVHELQKPAARRVLNAAYRTGNAVMLVAAAQSPASDTVRAEALNLLSSWNAPSSRDAVTGLWRPPAKHDVAVAAKALSPVVSGLLGDKSELVRAEAIRAASGLGVKEAGPVLFSLVGDKAAAATTRREALKALGVLQDPKLGAAVELASKDADVGLRQEAIRLGTQVQSDGALLKLQGVLGKGSVREKQAAIGALGQLKLDGVDKILAGLLEQMLAGKLLPELQLDLLEAAAKSSAQSVKDLLAKQQAARDPKSKLAPYREVLFGGDAANGRVVFMEKVEASCVRCHSLAKEGGEVGPSLDEAGKKYNRETLLESIVDPNAKISPGFETVLVTLKGGMNYAGIVKKETLETLTLLSPEDGLVNLKVAEITKRAKGLSGMAAELGGVLSKRDLRDLIEFLASLK